MARRPPSADMFTQMLLMQNMQRQQQLATEQANFSAGLQAQRTQAEANVNQQKASLDAGIRRSIAKPVKLGTLLTSPAGLLGNPLLGVTRLSG